jgi:predicted Zn finger-like uncharacterized protein
MALATKCPHCNTVFRVAHDQLKLRGGIVRCGSCNEVFDGNAALLDPSSAPLSPPPPPAAQFTPPVAASSPAPLPEPTPLDQKLAALDTHAAEALSSEPIFTLELDTAMDAVEIGEVAKAAEAAASPADDEPAQESTSEPAAEANDSFDDEPISASPLPAMALPAEPAVLAAADNEVFDLDLDVEPEAEPPFDDALTIEAMSDEELEDALATELAAMEHRAPEHEPEDEEEPSPDAFADMLAATDRREPTLDEPTPEEPAPDKAPAAATITRRRDDELDDVDEEALVQLSSAGLAESQAARLHTLSAPPADDAAAAGAEDAADSVDAVEEDADEPGFVKRDRRRQKFGKAATIAMSLGSVLLVAALIGQGLTTFRNQIAAALPPLKPGLLAACNALGCKIELPAQIDDLTIEQGELQTLSETTFSFTTLLRNQSATAQAWPHIELVLDDAADKAVLRRVFTPRDYLGADVALDKGFAPHTEQSVKLYFELNQLKASGYHIAVFYP